MHNRKLVIRNFTAAALCSVLLSSCGGGGGSTITSTLSSTNTDGSFFTYKDAKSITGTISISATVLLPNTSKKISFLGFEAAGCTISSTTGLPTEERDATSTISLPFTIAFTAPCQAGELTLNTKETVYFKGSDTNSSFMPTSTKIVSYKLTNKTNGAVIQPNQNYAIKLIAQPTVFSGAGGNYAFVVSATKEDGVPLQNETLKFYELTSNDANITNGVTTFYNGISAPVIVGVKPNNTSSASGSKQYSFAVVVGSEIQTVSVTQPINDQSSANANPVFIIVPSVDAANSAVRASSLTIPNGVGSYNIFVKLSKNDALKDGAFLYDRLIAAPNSTISWSTNFADILNKTGYGTITSDANGNAMLTLDLKPNLATVDRNFALYLYNDNSFRVINVTQQSAAGTTLTIGAPTSFAKDGGSYIIKVTASKNGVPSSDAIELTTLTPAYVSSITTQSSTAGSASYTVNIAANPTTIIRPVVFNVKSGNASQAVSVSQDAQPVAP